jgi:nitrite reductase (NO-forming)
VTFGGRVVAGAFGAAALLSLLLPPSARLGWWLPVHLALAGAAGTAVASMLPFFVAALAVARPMPAWLHAAAIALVATGALLAAVGRSLDPGTSNAAAALGALLFIAGAGGVAAAAFLPLRGAAGQRRPLTEAAYLLGLVSVASGVALGGLFLAGEPAVLAAWSRLRVAHAWLNAFGFLSLVIAGTLLHFAPTVAGARIRTRQSGRLAVVAVAFGAWAGALGYGLGADVFVRVGAVGLVAGGAALTWHAARVELDKAGWSTDPGWHRFTSWSLLAAPAWLLAAVAIVAAAALPAGSSGAGWRLEPVMAPLVAGFALQVLLGSMAHLVPAIGPGGGQEHARARKVLGRRGGLRVAAWNGGTAALSAGLLLGVPGPALAGAATIAAALMATVVLLLVAWRPGQGRRPAAPPAPEPR